MFVKVPYTHLLEGKKYKIKTPCMDFTGICAGSQLLHNYGIRFNDVKGRYDYGNILFSANYQFYEFVTQNPQANMERRAVTMILQRLIGDDHFEW